MWGPDLIPGVHDISSSYYWCFSLCYSVKVCLKGWNVKLLCFLLQLIHILGRSFWIIEILCFSSNSQPLILAAMGRLFFPQELLLWSSNGDLISLSFLPHLLI